MFDAIKPAAPRRSRSAGWTLGKAGTISSRVGYRSWVLRESLLEIDFSSPFPSARSLAFGPHLKLWCGYDAFVFRAARCPARHGLKQCWTTKSPCSVARRLTLNTWAKSPARRRLICPRAAFVSLLLPVKVAAAFRLPARELKHYGRALWCLIITA